MMATIQGLHEVLMFKIFSHYIESEGHEKFLRNISRVCKRWNKLSTEAPLWKNVRVRDLKFLQHLSQRGLLYDTQRLKLDKNESFYELNLSPVLENIRDLKALHLGHNDYGSDVMKLVTENCPHLQLLHLEIPESTTSHELDQFLTVCGPTLKHLYLYFYGSREDGQKLLSAIAAKCPLLETFVFRPFHDTPFPIHELRSGCQKTRKLRFYDCQLIDTERKNSSLGFKELEEFRAINSDFNGEDIYFLLKQSVDLKCLQLSAIENMLFHNITKIPSEKVGILEIWIKESDENLKSLGDAVFKWRHTLTDLNLLDWKCDVSSILERYLEHNQNPQIKSLAISNNIDLRFFQEFIQKCQNLNHLNIEWEEYEGREEIEETLKLLVKGENCAYELDRKKLH